MFLEIHLTVVEGCFPGMGELSTVLRLTSNPISTPKAKFQLLNLAAGRSHVPAGHGNPRLREVEELIGLAAAAGLPERAPRVQRVLDTSDVFLIAALTISTGSEPRVLTLSLQASGYDGPDRDPLQAFFLRLFEVVATYTCRACDRRWLAISTDDTGFTVDCGHFMPVYARYCAVCGDEIGSGP